MSINQLRLIFLKKFNLPDEFLSVSGLRLIVKRDFNLSFKQPIKLENGTNKPDSKMSRYNYFR